MRETGKSKTCVWRWQERFADEGVDGLLHHKTRPSRIPKLDPLIVARVVALTMAPPPSEATHWTGAAMAEAAGVSVTSVQRIWRAHGLKPHRVRPFKLSKDPEFVDKLRDVVGLYVDPPAQRHRVGCRGLELMQETLPLSPTAPPPLAGRVPRPLKPVAEHVHASEQQKQNENRHDQAGHARR